MRLDLPMPKVMARHVQDWKTLKPDTPCIVILKDEQDFVFKQVSLQKEKDYQPYTVPVDEVLEIWQHVKHQTDTLPETKTGLQEIKTPRQQDSHHIFPSKMSICVSQRFYLVQ